MNQLYTNALNIVSVLRSYGHEAYFCGGCVRDMLSKQDWKDIDIATSADPDQIESIFGEQQVIQCGKNFLVCRVKLGEGEAIEVATFRVERDYYDGRHPATVKKGTLEEDAQRRDLTINALYFDPITQEVIDPTGQGVDDLFGGIVRFVGNPTDRIREDHIRILRAIRFGSKPKFDLEEQAIKAILQNVRLILSSPAEAVKDELNKGFTGNLDVGKYFDILYALDVFKTLIPEVHDLHGCEQTPKHHPEGDVFQHVRLMLLNAKNEFNGLSVPMVWAILMHDIAKPHTKAIDPETGYITNHGHAEEGEPIARRIMEDLRFDNKTVDAVCYGVRNHMKFCQAKKMRKHKLIHLLKHEHGPLLLDLHWVDCASSNGLFDNFEYAHEVLLKAPEQLVEKKSKVPSIVDGNELMELGYKQGIQLGNTLKDINNKYLDGEIQTKEEAIEYARAELSKETSR